MSKNFQHGFSVALNNKIFVAAMFRQTFYVLQVVYFFTELDHMTGYTSYMKCCQHVEFDCNFATIFGVWF